MLLHTCVSAEGRFIYGIHKPRYRVTNLRAQDHIAPLGRLRNGETVDNQRNFPPDAIEVGEADRIYEIPNPFPFRGTTYIGKNWADDKAGNPEAIRLPDPAPLSFRTYVNNIVAAAGPDPETIKRAYRILPDPLLLTIAANSTDPEDLKALAHLSCDFVVDRQQGLPVGLEYDTDDHGRVKPVIHNHDLFEAVVNNPFLPDRFKEVMVLRPGVQGGSEIVGEWFDEESGSHIFEYLRRNSYIPWGHYAANMAGDAVRYSIHNLSPGDMRGLRHLYYQRIYVNLADQSDLPVPGKRRGLSGSELEVLRQQILAKVRQDRLSSIPFNCTLWGWNFGFDFAPSGYRMHASHQQIHQQFAMLPAQVERGDSRESDGFIPSFACGDLVGAFSRQYRETTGVDFFASYLKAIRGNERMDGRKDLEQSLIIHEDEHVLLFVPKAQTSQWEVQLMSLGPVGNILEATTAVREALDHGIFIAMKILTGLGARMITTIEFSKRFSEEDGDQRLLYSFLPKLPQSPGAMSEAQLRFINGHYPEDFAEACRRKFAVIKHFRTQHCKAQGK